MIVNWKGGGLMTCSPIDLSPEADHSKDVLIKAIVFYPGYNQIEDDVWNMCKPHMAPYFEADLIEEKSKKDKIDADGLETFIGVPFENIAARKESEAINLVKNCLNPQTLDLWEKETNRSNIQTEIRVQRDCIAAGRDIRAERKV
jgi:hypothetical protein